MDRGQQAAWSTHLEDMDNDGLLDAAATFGPVTRRPGRVGSSFGAAGRTLVAARRWTI